MNELERNLEMGSERERLPYGAVPWDPWKAAHPLDSSSTYMQVSLDHVYDILHRNMSSAVETGYRVSDERYPHVQAFLEDSLRNAQVQRIMHNGQHPMPDTLTGNPEVIQAAKEGTATPIELLNLLALNPDVPSTELAKLSHPFNFEATRELDRAIIVALEEYQHQYTPSQQMEPRYKIKRVEPGIPAASVLQKRELGDIQLADGDTIRLVRRQTLFARGDDEIVDNSGPQPKGRMIKRALDDADASARLTRTVHEALQNYEHAVESPWVQPITTSVYAYRVTDAV